MPERIQRRRTKGWRMPEGAIYVGRPSKWGNPFRIGHTYNGPGLIRDAAHAVETYRAWLGMNDYGDDPLDFTELAGHDLACWCPDQPCHADVLLEIANSGGPETTA